MTNQQTRIEKIKGLVESRFHFESKYTTDRNVITDGVAEEVAKVYGPFSKEEVSEIASKLAYLFDKKR